MTRYKKHLLLYINNYLAKHPVLKLMLEAFGIILLMITFYIALFTIDTIAHY